VLEHLKEDSKDFKKGLKEDKMLAKTLKSSVQHDKSKKVKKK
jgi:hypothetical protein